MPLLSEMDLKLELSMSILEAFTSKNSTVTSERTIELMLSLCKVNIMTKYFDTMCLTSTVLSGVKGVVVNYQYQLGRESRVKQTESCNADTAGYM